MNYGKVIFVFGSNLAGRHGKGAALVAVKQYGAKYGIGEGLQGHSYALPTKDENLVTLTADQVQMAVSRFITFAYENPSYLFYFTAVGQGLAGYTRSEIINLLPEELPYNVVFTKDWVS